MRKIKKLILTHWFRAFFLSGSIFLLILTVANLVAGLLRGHVTITEVFLNHLITLPSFSDKIIPFCCMAASSFSVNKLKETHQLTAMFASGFTRKNFFWAIFQASFLVAVGELLILGLLDPTIRSYRGALGPDMEAKFRGLKGQGLAFSTLASGKIWYKTEDYFFSFSSYNKRQRQLSHVSIFFLDDLQIDKILMAPRATYREGNTWTFHDGKILTSAGGEGFAHEESFSRRLFTIDETLSDFEQIESDITTLNLMDLANYVQHLKRAGIATDEYTTILLGKFSAPLISIVLSLLAALGAVNPGRKGGGFFKALGLSFISLMVFWLIHSFLLEQGKSGRLDPYVANFAMPMAFGVALLGLLFRHRRLN